MMQLFDIEKINIINYNPTHQCPMLIIIIYSPMDQHLLPLIHPQSQHNQNQQLSTLMRYSEGFSSILQTNSSNLEIKNIKKLQKSIRAYLIRVKLKQQFKKIHRRRRIIKQMIDTEQGYIRDLGYIVSDFKMRMRSRGILNDDECKKLFANVDEIRKLHDIFFAILHSQFVKFHPYQIIFKEVVNNILYFRIYIEYLDNFPSACDLVVELKKKKPQFASFVAEISKSQQYRFLSLQDYMVMPIQRLPKYVLLLKQLIKNTLPSHPDYQNVKKALSQFQQVNNNNNEKLNKLRNSFKIRQLQTMLQLPQGIITQTTEFILEQAVHILSQQNNQVLTNCVIYLLSNMVIVTRRIGSLLNRQTQGFNATTHSARISRASGINSSSNFKQKLQAMVPLKYGTSLKFNKDQCFYKNSFIVQSPEGQSCTFICSSQQQLHNLSTALKKQMDIVKQQTMTKLKSMFSHEHLSQNTTFIKNISMLDLVPEVNVLGTSERTDKMLKYTVYIVQVKVKMIKQKIFLRFSELLELQRFINDEYKDKLVIKQGLVSSSWLNNHHQKTIEERKMNIQRFLTEILSKPEVIENGWRILLRLGLPLDFYQLPNKLYHNKSTEDFYRKSSIFSRSTLTPNFKKKNYISTKNATKFRLSLFQQQKIQEEQQENSEEEPVQELIRQSFHNENNNILQQPKHNTSNSEHHHSSSNVNPKSSYSSSNHSANLCIQDILKANEIDLGHYTRQQSIELPQNNPFAEMEKSDTIVDINILVPCLESLYSIKRNSISGRYTTQNSGNNRSQSKIGGFVKITLKCSKLQRIQNIIPMIAKEIGLKYYKDFRLLVEKQYSQRVLDDDELVHKIISQIGRTKSSIFFRKIIYIDHQIEQQEIIGDRERLMVLSSQIINQIKMGKYRLNYQSYLKFAVLSAIVYQQSLTGNETITYNVLNNLAKQAKNAIFPKYSSLSQTENVWIQDFIKAYRIISKRLNDVIQSNFEHVEKQTRMSQEQQQQNNYGQFNEQSFCLTNNSFWVNTNIKYLAMLSIIKQIEKKQHLYGCMSFSVQISEQFMKYLQQNNYEIEDVYQDKTQTNTNRRYSEQITSQNKNKFEDNTESIAQSRKLSDEENKNCWLAIKHNKVLFTSISKNAVILQFDYEDITKVETYSSAVILQVKNMDIRKIKLKTTSSYYIREMLVYYRNYRSVLKKLYTDNDLRDSIIGISRDETGEKPHQEMDQYYL